MIVETLVTTCDLEGVINLAPMGPIVNRSQSAFTLRPFRPSRTFDNLCSTRRAVIHLTDDVLLFAKAVTNQLRSLPAMRPVDGGKWHVIEDACRYFVVEITDWQDDPLRATAHCQIVEQGELRPFFGFNRAKHAVIEGAILATRTHLLAAEEINRQLAWLQSWVEKTGGDAEREAWEIVVQEITTKLSGQPRNK